MSKRMGVGFTRAIFDSYIPDIHGGKTPAFANACQHGDDEYVGTVRQFKRVEGEVKLIPLDVYVHDGDIGGANVCIRYGDAGHEYVSVGTILDFLAMAAARHDYFPEVATLLVHEFDFSCERGKE